MPAIAVPTVAQAQETILDRAYHWEQARAQEIFFTQPVGGGQVTHFTWHQALDQARRMAAHLKSLDLPERSHIAIFSKNTAWWILSDLAIWLAGHVSIPIYPTLTSESIREILEHSESRLIFIGKLDGWEAMRAGIPADLPGIALPLSPAQGYPAWDELVKARAPLADSPRRSEDDLATIHYTSGSTGMPKGVMIDFGAMSRAARGITSVLSIDERDRMLSYLPLAHCLERLLVESAGLLRGFHIYFAESLDTFVHDLRRARPTLFVSVPRLWLKFQLGVFAKMPPRKLGRLLRIPILSRIVRKKILTQLGLDAVRFAGSGSAPIPPDVIQWYRDLGLELLEGYGMTENFAYSHCSRPSEARVGYVGHCYPDVEQRISPEGEIQLRSRIMMKGYYKADDLTAAAFTHDGWLKTGDRGEIDPQGRLRITGRVKELFKTSKGKYVAPAPIENKLLTHGDLEMACVTGSGCPQAYALVQPSEAARQRLRGGQGREELTRSLTDLLQSVNAGLDAHEQLAFLAVLPEPWTIENGSLTPTMKLKRNVVEERHRPQQDAWFTKRERVIWA